ncbi:hemolysin family protein [bacterium]|nr:hemolysin family protein [bacterium]MBU1674185.1 hemolysin family protein [bacterium]
MTAVLAYVVAMMMIGLLAAFFRVSGLARHGLLEPEAVRGVAKRLLDEPRHFILTVGTIYLAATGIGCVATAAVLSAVWPDLSDTKFYLVIALLVVLAWSLGGTLIKLSASGAALGYTRFFGHVLVPVTWLLRPWTALLTGAAGRLDDTMWGVEAMPHLSTGEIRSLIKEEEDGVNLEEDEREMIQSIFGFHETTVKEIMVPRIDMVALDASTPVFEALGVVAACRHSRIPLHEGNVDKITGLLYTKDLLALVDRDRLGNGGKALGDLARPAYFVPESKKLDEVLAEFRAKRIHLAVVIDEYGGTAGVVTLEDVLEVIVGEIEGEFDVTEQLYQWVDECTLLVDPKIDLEDLRDLLGVDLPLDEGSETLAGLIYEAAGKVPAAGDRTAVAGLDIEVEKVEDQRILRARVIAGSPFPGYGPRKDVSP